MGANKIVAAELPGYLPGRAFFQKLKAADIFIIADDVKFSPGTFVSRARIRRGTTAQWLTIPVYHSGKTLRIRETKIDHSQPWLRKHWRSLATHYAYAPYWEFIAEVIEPAYQTRRDFLMDFNLDLLQRCMRMLGISTPLRFSSQFTKTGNPSRRIAGMVAEVGGTTYLADSEDRNFLDSDAFQHAGIELQFCPPERAGRAAEMTKIAPDFSIVDALAFQGPHGVNF